VGTVQGGVVVPVAGGVNDPAVGVYQSEAERGPEKMAADEVWRAKGYPKVANWKELSASTTGGEVSGSAVKVTTSSNSLVGTDAGDVLGLEPGTPATVVVRAPTVVNSVPYSTYKSSPNNVLKNGVNLSQPLKF